MPSCGNRTVSHRSTNEHRQTWRQEIDYSTFDKRSLILSQPKLAEPAARNNHHQAPLQSQHKARAFGLHRNAHTCSPGSISGVVTLTKDLTVDDMPRNGLRKVTSRNSVSLLATSSDAFDNKHTPNRKKNFLTKRKTVVEIRIDGYCFIQCWRLVRYVGRGNKTYVAPGSALSGQNGRTRGSDVMGFGMLSRLVLQSKQGPL